MNLRRAIFLLLFMTGAWLPAQDLPFSSGSTGADGAFRTRAIPDTARFGHGMVFDAARGEVVMFGGNNADNSTWTWSGGDWVKKFPANSPAARYGHSIAYDPIRRRVVVFGGYLLSGVYANDTWLWDGTNWAATASGESPSPRYLQKMVFDVARGNVLLFGGSGDQGTLNDTWTWNGTNWTQLFPVNSPAGYLASHALAYDAARAEVVHHEGGNGETWVWNGVDWVLRDTQLPAFAHHSAMVYDSMRQMVVAFGGNYGGIATSARMTWTWDGTRWTGVETETAPEARIHHAMAYDPLRRRTVLFSGAGFLNTSTPLDRATWLWDGTNWAKWSGEVLTIDMASKPNGVWNFTSIDVGSNITIRFKKTVQNAPVRWLASSNITINGILDLRGENASAPHPTNQMAAGGPGGFAGGLGGIATQQSGTAVGAPGEGPGGGTGGRTGTATGSDGRYAGVYGNSYLQPLIGGSGGGGGASGPAVHGGNGGGGGGAILLASSRDIVINGQILASGGGGSWSGASLGGAGSGGAILLKADRISGNGSLLANNNGRIRLEAYSRTLTGSSNPAFLGSGPFTDTGVTNRGTLNILSVDGVPVPIQPGGNTFLPDITFTNLNPVSIVVSSTGIPNATPVRLRITTATGTVNVTNILNSGLANFSVAVPPGIGSIQALSEFRPN